MVLLELRVNGVVKRKAKLSEMSIPIHHQISKISEWSPIQAGDLLFTGTPSGVGKLGLGDKMHAVLMDGDGKILSKLMLHVLGLISYMEGRSVRPARGDYGSMARIFRRKPSGGRFVQARSGANRDFQREAIRSSR